MSSQNATNLTQTHYLIATSEREVLTGHHGVVVWMTGLSGAGKSSIAVGLDHYLNQQRQHSFILDGDNLRSGLCADLSFSDEDRHENIRRAGEVAKLMAEAGLIVICALISPFAADRQVVRESCAKSSIPFMEVFINAPSRSASSATRSASTSAPAPAPSPASPASTPRMRHRSIRKSNCAPT